MAKQIVNKEGIVIPQGTMEDFNRPNHADFMTHSELVARKFSGLRHNCLNNDAEIWIEGEIQASVTELAISLDPDALNKAFEKVFALGDVMPDHAQARASRGDK